MSTFDEVIAAAQANIAALDQAGAEIEATKAQAEQTQQQAMMLGAERLAHGAQGLIESCQGAQDQIAAAKEKLREVIAGTNQLKAYEPGGGGGSDSATATVATQRSDGTPLPEPDGEKLLEDSSPQARGFRGMRDFMTRKGDGVEDVAQTSGKLLDIGWKSVGHEPIPTTGLRAGVEVPTDARIEAQPGPQVGAGSVILGTFVLSMVTAKASDKVGDLAHRMWKARGNDKR